MFVGTSLPEDYFGLAFDGFMFFLLALTWQASKYYNWIMRRLTARERIRIRWGVHPEWDIVPQAGPDAGDAAFSNGPAGRTRRSFQPRLVALEMISSTLTRPFAARTPSSLENASASKPAVWASLSQELKPYDGKHKGPRNTAFITV